MFDRVLNTPLVTYTNKMIHVLKTGIIGEMLFLEKNGRCP